MKKFLAIFLALLMVCTVALVSCKKDEPVNDDGDNWDNEENVNNNNNNRHLSQIDFSEIYKKVDF